MPAHVKSSHDPVRVLVIEDESFFQSMIRMALQRSDQWDGEVIFADRLGDGIEQLAHRRVDVVLLDLNLPDSEGIDTLVALQRQSPSTPVIVLTGLEDGELAKQGLRMGARDFLLKSHVFTGDPSVATLPRAIDVALAAGEAG